MCALERPPHLLLFDHPLADEGMRTCCFLVEPGAFRNAFHHPHVRQGAVDIVGDALDRRHAEQGAAASALTVRQDQRLAVCGAGFAGAAEAQQNVATTTQKGRAGFSIADKPQAALHELQRPIITIGAIFTAGGVEERPWRSLVFSPFEMLGADDRIALGKPLRGAAMQRLSLRPRQRQVGAVAHQGMSEQEVVAGGPQKSAPDQGLAVMAGISQQIAEGVGRKKLAENGGNAQRMAIAGRQHVQPGEHDTVDAIGQPVRSPVATAKQLFEKERVASRALDAVNGEDIRRCRQGASIVPPTTLAAYKITLAEVADLSQ